MQPVVGEQFCLPFSTAFTVEPQPDSRGGGDFSISDNQNGTVFDVRGPTLAIRSNRVLSDALGKPVCALQAKVAIQLTHMYQSCPHIKLLLMCVQSNLLASAFATQQQGNNSCFPFCAHDYAKQTQCSAKTDMQQCNTDAEPG